MIGLRASISASPTTTTTDTTTITNITATTITKIITGNNSYNNFVNFRVSQTTKHFNFAVVSFTCRSRRAPKIGKLKNSFSLPRTHVSKPNF
jgi:hypothetical protein